MRITIVVLTLLALSAPVASHADTPDSDARIVIWNEPGAQNTTSTKSQTVTGGDEGCLNFAVQIAQMRKCEPVPARCVAPNGVLRFNIQCTPVDRYEGWVGVTCDPTADCRISHPEATKP